MVVLLGSGTQGNLKIMGEERTVFKHHSFEFTWEKCIFILRFLGKRRYFNRTIERKNRKGIGN